MKYHSSNDWNSSAKPNDGLIHNYCRNPSWNAKSSSAPVRKTYMRYCHGYGPSNMNFRNVTDCMNWCKAAVPSSKYFFFRHTGNMHCAVCPSSYTGHATIGSASQAPSPIHVYGYPEPSDVTIWCYTTDANTRWEYCDPLPLKQGSDGNRKVTVYEHGSYSGFTAQFEPGRFAHSEFVKRMASDVLTGVSVPYGLKLTLW